MQLFSAVQQTLYLVAGVASAAAKTANASNAFILSDEYSPDFIVLMFSEVLSLILLWLKPF